MRQVIYDITLNFGYGFLISPQTDANFGKGLLQGAGRRWVKSSQVKSSQVKKYAVLCKKCQSSFKSVVAKSIYLIGVYHHQAQNIKAQFRLSKPWTTLSLRDYSKAV